MFTGGHRILHRDTILGHTRVRPWAAYPFRRCSSVQESFHKLEQHTPQSADDPKRKIRGSFFDILESQLRVSDYGLWELPKMRGLNIDLKGTTQKGPLIFGWKPPCRTGIYWTPKVSKLIAQSHQNTA